MPTAPESLPTAIVARAWASRRRWRSSSACQSGELQAEGHGLGVHPVGAADHGGVLVLEGPRLHRREQGVDVLADEVEGVAHQHGEGAVSTTSEEVRP